MNSMQENLKLNSNLSNRLTIRFATRKISINQETEYLIRPIEVEFQASKGTTKITPVIIVDMILTNPLTISL